MLETSILKPEFYDRLCLPSSLDLRAESMKAEVMSPSLGLPISLMATGYEKLLLRTCFAFMSDLWLSTGDEISSGRIGDCVFSSSGFPLLCGRC